MHAPQKGVLWTQPHCRIDHLYPGSFFPHIVLAQALAGRGNLDEAQAAIEEAQRIKLDLNLTTYARLLPADIDPEILEHLVSLLKRAGLPE